MKNEKHAMKNAKRKVLVSSYFAFFVACSSFFIPSLSVAQESWLLSTADFRTEQVTLRSIDEKGVHLTAGGQPITVAPERFLQLDRGTVGVAKLGRFMLHGISGDRLGGEPVKLENDRVVWRNTVIGELLMPLSQLAGVTLPDRSPDSAAPAEDVVLLANGDTVRGIITGLSADQVTVKTASADEPLAVPLASVVTLQFARTGATSSLTTSPATNARTYRVRLTDGSAITGKSLELVNEKLTLAIAGAEPRPIALASVAGIEQVNGPVSWLTSRQPKEDLQLPFIGNGGQSMWKTRTDVDVSGQPMVVGGKPFQRGIGVHTYSRLVYPLDGTYKAFRTRYGVNDDLTRADVTVRIRVDGKVAHEAKNVRGGVLSPVVVVDLGSAKELVLEADFGQGAEVEDRLNWLEPALLRDKPKPAQ
jgi:hypothetical protein